MLLLVFFTPSPTSGSGRLISILHTGNLLTERLYETVELIKFYCVTMLTDHRVHHCSFPNPS